MLAVVARNLHCGFADEDSHVMYVAEVENGQITFWHKTKKFIVRKKMIICIFRFFQCIHFLYKIFHRENFLFNIWLATFL